MPHSGHTPLVLPMRLYEHVGQSPGGFRLILYSAHIPGTIVQKSAMAQNGAPTIQPSSQT
jgi:hypothetical protein